MTFPFAVYTAHHGYAWSNIPDGFSEASLKRFEQIVTTSKPEYMNEGERFEGIIYAQAHLVVFSAMRVPNWDYSNRTALYYAFAFLPRLECKRINIDQLLKSPCFTTPSKEPKDAIDYAGTPSASAPENVIAAFKSGTPNIQSLDFAYCGDLLCEIGNISDKWWIFRTVGTASDGGKVVFEKSSLLSALKPMADSRPKVMSAREAKLPSSGGPESESRLISSDHSTDSDSAIRLEMKMATALKAIKKERESDVIAMAELQVRVNRLTIAVCVCVALAIASLGVILVDKGGIAKLSDILSRSAPEQQEGKVPDLQQERSGAMDSSEAKKESEAEVRGTNTADKATHRKKATIPEPDKGKSGSEKSRE